MLFRSVLIVPLLDFAMAVLRRLRAGQSPFAADRKHLHHRLVDMGHTHLQAVLVFYGWTTAFSLGCLAFLFLSWQFATVLTALALIACVIVTISPLSRRRATVESEQP